MIGLWVRGLPFGPDSHGTYATAETDVLLHPHARLNVVRYHALGDDVPEVLGYTTAWEVREDGFYFRVALEDTPENRRLARLARQGRLFASTAGIRHLCRVEDDGWMRVWAIGELSLLADGERPSHPRAIAYSLDVETLRMRYRRQGRELKMGRGTSRKGKYRITSTPLRADELPSDTLVEPVTDDAAVAAVEDAAATVAAVAEAVAPIAAAVDPAATPAAAGVPLLEGATVMLVPVAPAMVAPEIADVAANAGGVALDASVPEELRSRRGGAPVLRYGRGEPDLARSQQPIIDTMRAIHRGQFKRVQVFVNSPHFGSDPKEDLRSFLRTMNETTASAGGYAVFDEFNPNIIPRLRAQSVLDLLGATPWPILTDQQRIPRVTVGSTAAWSAEATALNFADMTLDEVVLNPKKAYALMRASSEVMEDNGTNPRLEAVFQEDMMAEINLARDLKGLRGDGTGNTPTGIRSLSGVTITELGAGNGATPTFADLSNVKMRRDTANAPAETRGWACSPRSTATLRTIVGSDGQYIWGDPKAPGDPPTIWGDPVRITTQIPNNLTVGASTDCSEIYYGAWSELLSGTRKALEFMLSPFAGAAFETDLIYFRVIGRFDFDIRHGASFEVLTGVRP